MTIFEMHSLFRTIGQQKGMQAIRAILPGEIDDYLNAAIFDFVHTVLKQTVNTIPFGSILLPNGLSPYNSIRTLYDETEYLVGKSSWNKQHFELNLSVAGDEIAAFLGLSVIYEKDGWRYPVRLISPSELAFTLNDWCNRPTREYPVAIINSDKSTKSEIHLYTDCSNKNTNHPYQCIVHTINTPKKISYVNNIDSDLPSYVHTEIVELAVQKFFQSIGSTSHPVQ